MDLPPEQVTGNPRIYAVVSDYSPFAIALSRLGKCIYENTYIATVTQGNKQVKSIL
jgi:hypothetical protein